MQAMLMGVLMVSGVLLAATKKRVSYIFFSHSFLSIVTLLCMWFLTDRVFSIIVLGSVCLFFFVETQSFILSFISTLTDKIRLQVHMSTFFLCSILTSIIIKLIVTNINSDSFRDTMVILTILEVLGQIFLAFSNPTLLKLHCDSYTLYEENQEKMAKN